MLRFYYVTIPYYHRFLVEAESEGEAIVKAHSEGNGTIVDYDDSLATVEVETFEFDVMKTT